MANGGIIGPVNTVNAAVPETVTTFTNSGTLTIQPSTKSIDTLIVAGGGGGGRTHGAGGGGGGYLCTTNTSVSSPVSIVVGAGGSQGQSGGTSSFSDNHQLLPL